MGTTHISVKEFVADAEALLARARAGEEIAIDDQDLTVLVVKRPTTTKSFGTPISELIAGLRADATENGGPLIMDEDFAADMRDIIANRKPRDTSAWD